MALFWAILQVSLTALAAPASAKQPVSAPELLALTNYTSAAKQFQGSPEDPEAAWKYSRACFDLGEFAADSNRRAELANEGITAARKAISVNTNSAAAHYYLGMNLGQLARTKGLGALKLVSQMRQEFSLSAALEPRLDYAGSDRNLGLLYRDTPAIGSIGNKKLARTHLERAVELVPDYPENRVALLEGYVKWGDLPAAALELKAAEELWPKAREKLAGVAWEPGWADWNRRLETVKKKLSRLLSK
jgi:tetratricopeptide (TPR) repeat protein